jgi:hypothetical protein
MPKSRSASDPLSQTTKSFLNEIFIKEVFSREKIVSTPAMEKGTTVESDSISLVEKIIGKTLFKNNKQLENDYIIGTPDLIPTEDKIVKDIKSSWDLWTFFAVDEKKAKSDYYHQMLGYMWLTEVDNAELLYALVNTPEQIMYREWSKLSWNMGDEAAEAYVRKNHTFSGNEDESLNIPDEFRVKRFAFVKSMADISEAINKIELSRAYLQTLYINLVKEKCQNI